MTEGQIALQLYTVRDLTARDMLGTLRTVAGIGYKALEFAGYGNASPEEIRQVLDETGMRAVSAHVGAAAWQEPETALQALKTLGCEYAVVPALPKEQRGSLEDARQFAARLNDWARLAQAQGIRFAYHNHDFEFAPLEGSSIWATLLAETEPSLVGIELDAYWAQIAGQNPIELIGRLAGRLPLLHMKDMANTPSRDDAPLGSGVLPWGPIMAAAARAGAAWYIVEQDNPRSPIDDVATSFQYLKRHALGSSLGTAPTISAGNY